MKRLVLIGAGGFARTLSDIATQNKEYDELLFLDDKRIEGTSGVCADYVNYIDNATEFFPAISNNSLRNQWITKLHVAGAKVASITHTSAYVSPTVMMDDGIAILPGAIVNTGRRLKSGVLVNCGAVIDHDCVIESCAHIRPNAVVNALSVINAEDIVN